MTLTVLVIATLATYRLARAVAVDDITEGVRQYAYQRAGGSHVWQWTFRLISCQHCIGFWIAFAVTGVWFWATGWPGTVEWLVFAAAAAGGQSAMASLLHRVDRIVP